MLAAIARASRAVTIRETSPLPEGRPNLSAVCCSAQFTAPQRRVVSLCGDGRFTYSWAERETLRRLRLPITVSVLNNGILAHQRHAEDGMFGKHTDAVDFTAVDHAAIAQACGVEDRRVEPSEDVGAAQDAAFSSGQPMLIDVITDLDTKQPIGFYAGRYPEPF